MALINFLLMKLFCFGLCSFLCVYCKDQKMSFLKNKSSWRFCRWGNWIENVAYISLCESWVEKFCDKNFYDWPKCDDDKWSSELFKCVWEKRNRFRWSLLLCTKSVNSLSVFAVVYKLLWKSIFNPSLSYYVAQIAFVRLQCTSARARKDFACRL